MSGFVEDYFDGFDLDFLANDFLAPNELADCYLNEEELNMFLTPSTEVWKDFLPYENKAVITMDSSKDLQWEYATNEFKHLSGALERLLGVSNKDEVTMDKLVLFVLGPNSSVGKYLRDELSLDEDQYVKFMSIWCLQAAHHVSSTQVFHSESLLKAHAPMDEKSYNGIWKLMANKKKLTKAQMSDGRREIPLWEKLESLANELLRSVSITDRKKRIAIALDDDKIWLNIKNSTAADLFNLKYTTHVQPNRKGINGHTATSTSLMIPLGIVFERTRDSTLDCFKRCLNFLFGRDGSTRLRDVSVHSDRGYLIPSLVFEYLIASGAEVVGTVKRMAQCWPFTYEQKLSETDNRRLIEPKGAATLYLKWCKAGPKYLFASAFRNGTGRVATAISTMHTQHQWEGVVMDEREIRKYKEKTYSEGETQSTLAGSFFSRMDGLGEKIEKDESSEEREILDKMIDTQIEPFTLRQGK